jgi:hypothetical protein
MKKFKRILSLSLMLIAPSLLLTSCDGSNTSVYGSIGVSSGYSSYRGAYNSGYYNGYNSGPRMRGSITIGGRIR